MHAQLRVFHLLCADRQYFDRVSAFFGHFRCIFHCFQDNYKNPVCPVLASYQDFFGISGIFLGTLAFFWPLPGHFWTIFVTGALRR